MSDIDNHAYHGASSPDKPSSRGSGHDSTRMRRRDGDRKSFHDHRDRHRDDKYEGFKGRGKYDSYNRQRGRDYDRHNDYDRDRDTRNRYGAHSKRSRRESRSRSRSRSPSQSEGKRTSGFDMAPPATGVTPTVSGQMPGIAHMIQGATQNFSPYGISQATRHARRVYVGGLPPFANEQSIASFFSQVMIAIGGNSAGSGDSVVNVYINHEKKFAFVEMRTVEEASNAMALDGIVFEGVAVRVRRPTDYNPSLAAVLGPCQPSANLNLSAVGLSAGTIGGAEGLDRIFVGGLPYYFTEVQMRELLQAFGPLRSFDIVRDKETGNSKGYGFCIYQDPAVTDIACAALNGLKMGDKTLTVRRATVSAHSKPEEDNIFARAQQHIAMQKIALEVVGLNIPGVPTNDESPTKVLCLTEAVTTEQLTDNGEYEEILEDMRDECRKFGTLVNVVIPRPNPNGELSTGIGKVFLEYSDCTACLAAKNALNGRKFGGSIVTAFYYPEEKYHSMDYDL
ncbi:splicing factor U2af large subunit A isoform X2 [Medicago truncatula]|uniref:Splicing factor U2af large subunit n=1 Tax=Medicago truncatula TaxID=3880 RepID=A0A072VED3_MEDTR|nr:splicing factor U2af large subunit A isoform X2 [Medicago truncatula]KEH36535.1 U2 snRNP auxilliary factor, large subunit, splicing factor [Medicago truncatula]